MELMKEWILLVYAFFQPQPTIIEVVTVHCYTDTKDARLTSNLRKHVKVCKGWGKEILEMANQAKNADEAKTKIIGRFLHNGTITAMFERRGKGQVTYSHRQHTHEEMWYTGRPDYYLPLAATVGWMLQEYKGRISFTTDAWTSPNHHSFVAFSAHLEHKGKPLAFLLDIIEVAKVSICQ
ncbi:hypothetical protein BS17DRAFT_792926 [Gyrodon lividus]|nr:hypothetical protein BS17DRAFT_798611 [Gyrodon lividus]KAF9228929.1 hypothetical protein BS17DRAFT_792926 [Gyrodon lividus]